MQSAGGVARALMAGWLLVVAVLVAMAADAAPAQGKGKQGKGYCTRHSKPRGCVRVPTSARRPSRRIDQQGPGSLTPTDVVNGGGLGGGPGRSRRTALGWAKSQVGMRKWAWRCQRFVEEAYGTRAQFDSARSAMMRLRLRRGSPKAAPVGALVYFAPDRYNRRWGHVGVSLGGGRMISALSRVTITDVAKSPYWRRGYLGWADAPTSWPGRIPPPPGTTTDTLDTTVRITAPAPASIQSGSIELLATAPGVGGVAFDAYYASNPADASTRRWHRLGTATERDGAWSLTVDSTTIPDQGFGAWGTVNLAATALDGHGRRTAVRDYRRVAISNGPTPIAPSPVPQLTGELGPAHLDAPTAPTPSTPTTPATPVPQAPVTTATTTTSTTQAPVSTTPTTTTPTTATPPALPTETWPETTGGAANTWSDYRTAGGTPGPQLMAYQTIEVRCRREGYQVPDGNTWWYLIASPPWSDRFYVTADATYNNGATSGSMARTPFVDEAVAMCPEGL